jgi:hypothetical protein
MMTAIVSPNLRQRHGHIAVRAGESAPVTEAMRALPTVTSGEFDVTKGGPLQCA